MRTASSDKVSKQKLRLGLDLGTNSIGWVLYVLDESDPPQPVALLDGGVLIHTDGRNPKSGASKASHRREKRGMRRNRDRMIQRRQRLARSLHKLGLLPDDDAERAKSRTLNPLQLRAEGLDRKLEAHELGRVLMTFVDKRGFKSNRKTDGGEGGKIREAVSEQRRNIQQSGARTLGEYLWKRQERGKTIRANLEGGLHPDRAMVEGDGTTGTRQRTRLYPDRAMVEDELEAIRKAQEPHHPHITRQDWDTVVETVLFQRPLRPVERGVCTFLPDKERIDKAHPLFQRFRIWQDVVNIKVASPGESFRSLTTDERKRLVDKLLDYKDRTFDQIAADLGLLEGTRINFRSTNREKIDGDQTAATLRANSRFGKAGWKSLSLEEQQELVERLTDEADYQPLVDWLQERFGLGEDAAAKVANTRLLVGTGHLSKAAIERILPHLREGIPYHDAVTEAGFGHHSNRHGDGDEARLPYYGEVLPQAVGGRPDSLVESEKLGRVANPTVHIALGQVRKLFNAIVDNYGKPHEVVVELGREVKQNLRERKDYQLRQRRNRERNDELRELASMAGYPNPSARDMEKLRLWAEQGKPNERLCPFTGETLSIERVLSSDTETEHLLPYSRSLDNSMNNKVVAMTHANREKGNRTPFEAWGHDPEHYESILARARLLGAKEWRFEEGAMESWAANGKFLDRQLNENRYLSRLVRDYLEAAIPHNRVWVTPGRMTAKLRRDWGLNSILSGSGEDRKQRDDHRHHLVDAAVIGLTSRSLLQEVASASGLGHHPSSISPAPLPWDGYRSDVKDLVERCVVRHRPDQFTVLKDKRHRSKQGRDVTSGALHNDTAYGIVWDSDGEPKRDDRGNFVLVETKPLDSLKSNKLDDVRDRWLREHLKRLWEKVRTANPNESESWVQKKFAEQARAEFGVRRVRVYLRLGEASVEFIHDQNGRPYKAYKTDGNAYMDIWLLPSRKTRGEVVSRFRANRPDNRSRIKDEYPTAKKLMRLHKHDMVAMGEGDERRIYRVQKLSDQKVSLFEHQQAGKSVTKQATRVLDEKLRKVSVDVLGTVKDGGPFGPDGQRKRGNR